MNEWNSVISLSLSLLQVGWWVAAFLFLFVEAFDLFSSCTPQVAIRIGNLDSFSFMFKNIRFPVYDHRSVEIKKNRYFE